MRICYVLLSPTFGMHQYTADLANRFAQLGTDVHLVTTSRLPRDRYVPGVTVHTPVASTNTGFSLEGLGVSWLRRTSMTLNALDADVVHFTGPHLWNPLLARGLGMQGIPTVQTLHDLDPHRGVRFGPLIQLWNHLMQRSAQHILVHSRSYHARLLGSGLPPHRVSWTPLLHLFAGGAWQASLPSMARSVEYEPWALFFGRLERYKGLDDLITACAMLNDVESPNPCVVLAGPGNLRPFWADALPSRLELRNRLIQDAEAVDLFRRCGLVVLPYVDATQSALIAAAYYFRKPVVVTRCGALPEYVIDGETGRVLEPGHPPTLARCLEELLADPSRLARMGTAGRAWYEAHRPAEEWSMVRMYGRLARTKRAGAIAGGASLRTMAAPPAVREGGYGG